jgi:hypothetical protein
VSSGIDRDDVLAGKLAPGSGAPRLDGGEASSPGVAEVEKAYCSPCTL